MYDFKYYKVLKKSIVILSLLLAGWKTSNAQKNINKKSEPEKMINYELNDSHFHLTNYVQEGTDIKDFLNIMGNRVGRVALFGIPLQQMWDKTNTGEFAPTYYLQSDAPLYYY